MINNIGTIDRIFRIVLGCALIGFALLATDVPYSYLGWIGVIPFATAIVNFCPLYSLLGMKTS
jgi:hypothetical protein